MNNRKLFNDKEELESSMLNHLNLQKEKQINEEDKSNQIEDN
jgi:NADH-quinone oxidoreductase subunit G